MTANADMPVGDGECRHFMIRLYAGDWVGGEPWQ